MPHVALLPLWKQTVRKLFGLWTRIWFLVLPLMVLVPEGAETLNQTMAFMLVGILTLSLGETARSWKKQARLGTSQKELFKLWLRIIPVTTIFFLLFQGPYMALAIPVMLLSIPVIARDAK